MDKMRECVLHIFYYKEIENMSFFKQCGIKRNKISFVNLKKEAF